MRNGNVPLAGAASDFAQRKLRGRVAGIEFQLLLKFFLGLRGVGLRLAFGKRDAPQAEMNPWNVGILVEYLLVFRGSFCPSVLRLEGLSLKFLRLVGTGRFSRKFLRSARGQLAKIMRGDVENFWI